MNILNRLNQLALIVCTVAFLVPPLLIAAENRGSVSEIIFQSSFEELQNLIVSQEVPPNNQTMSAEQAVPVGLFFVRPGTTSGTNFSASVDGIDLTGCRVQSNNISCDPKVFSVGQHRARTVIGNASHEWVFNSVMPPHIVNVSPIDVNVPVGQIPNIEATIRDARANLDFNSIVLKWNNTDVTSQVSITKVSEKEAKLRFSPPLVSLRSQNSVRVAARAVDRIEGSRDWGFGVIRAPERGVQIELPDSTSVSLIASVPVVIKTRSSFVNVKKVEVGDFLVRPVSFDGIGNGVFSTEVILRPGSNDIVAVVTYDDGFTLNASKTLIYDAPPLVTITSPEDFKTFGPITANNLANIPGGALNLTGVVDRPISITGNTSRVVESVLVNQQSAVLSGDGKSFTFNNFFLKEGVSQLSVNATDALGRVGTSNITVYVDQTAPILAIENPTSGSITSNSSFDIRGLVDDVVEAGIGASQPSVLIKNEANGKQITALVSDKFFVGRGMALEVGSNVIFVFATDAAGNTRSKEISITRIMVGSNRLTLISGNEQIQAVKTLLLKPLEIFAFDSSGAPLVDLPIRFDVLRGAGTISNMPDTPNRPNGIDPARNLEVRTNASGTARVWLTLGDESSPAGNVVRASNIGIAEDTIFTATGTRGLATLILVDSSASNQFAQVNSQPIDPLTVVVYDRDYNRVVAGKVRYTIETGDAKFITSPNTTVSPDGQTMTMITDKNGNATARPMLGNTAGNVRIAAIVEISANESIGAAVFNITSLERKTGPTQFSGVVMNHTGMPLLGARVSIGRTNLSATTNVKGEFKFQDQVPAGKIDLFIDGRTIQTTTNEQYPALHFETATIQGQKNQLPHSIYLPPINISHAVIVGGANDVKITIPGYEGFEMNVKANSVTFPDGTKTGPLVVSPVHGDRLPMVPPGGSANFGAVAWTIQPTGTRAYSAHEKPRFRVMGSQLKLAEQHGWSGT